MALALGDMNSTVVIVSPTSKEVGHPARIRLQSDDSDRAADIMVEFSANGHQPRTVAGAGNHSIAAELAAEDLDLGVHETDTGIAARGESFGKEVLGNVEPAQHDQSIFEKNGVLTAMRGH